MTAPAWRPAAMHDDTCTAIRWVHHRPWRPGAPVIEHCTGCTAVRRVDGSRVRPARRPRTVSRAVSA